MARKGNVEQGSEKKRPSAKYFRLHPQHERAVKNWVELHGADETIVYKVGAFLFMSLPLEQRVRATRRYLEWVQTEYPAEALNWPDMDARDEDESDRPFRGPGYKDRIGEIDSEPSSV